MNNQYAPNYLSPRNNYDTQALLKLDEVLKKSYGTDILDLIELEEEIGDMFALFSALAEGEVVEEKDMGFNGFDPGGCVADSSKW